MRVTILGSGAAGGVPMISAGWGNCDPNEPRNRRLRPSILVQDQGQTILVDSSPDMREQLLRAEIRHLDAVLFTHGHADHTHGIDDLREVNRAMQASIPVFGSQETLDDIAKRFGYVFEPLDFSTTPIYKPCLIPHVVGDAFPLGGLSITPIEQDHGYAMTTGFRFGKMAYSTDVWELPESSLAKLEGLDLWIVGCLLDVPHPTHAHVDKVLGWVERLKPKRTVLTHMSPRLDYATLRAQLPDGVEPGYDGQQFEL